MTTAFDQYGAIFLDCSGSMVPHAEAIAADALSSGRPVYAVSLSIWRISQPSHALHRPEGFDPSLLAAAEAMPFPVLLITDSQNPPFAVPSNMTVHEKETK